MKEVKTMYEGSQNGVRMKWKWHLITF